MFLITHSLIFTESVVMTAFKDTKIIILLSWKQQHNLGGWESTHTISFTKAMGNELKWEFGKMMLIRIR